MKKEIYFSIRTVKAENTKDAIEEVKSGNFDESHPICDKVLTKKELLKELNSKTKYAVLTDDDGNICGVISYNKMSELRTKTLDIIEEIQGEISHHLSSISLERSFTVVSTNKESGEYYLTPTDIN